MGILRGMRQCLGKSFSVLRDPSAVRYLFLGVDQPSYHAHTVTATLGYRFQMHETLAALNLCRRRLSFSTEVR